MATLEDSLVVSYKTKQNSYYTIQQSCSLVFNQLYGKLTRMKMKIFMHTKTCMQIGMEVLLKNHPKLETTQNPLNWAIDRQIVGILVSTKKKEFLIHSTTRTNLICMVRPERIQPHNTTNSVIQFI